MSYFKVIRSGDVVEVYEYEKPPVLSESKYNEYEKIFLGLKGESSIYEDWLELRKDRVLERRTQTVRDARNKARRLALMNFGPGDKFLTLTFDPKRLEEEQMRSIDFVDKEFKKFIQRLNYRLDTKIKYIAVRELHKSGRFHLHMLCSLPIDFTSEDEIRYWEVIFGQEIWKHGFVDIKPIDHVDNVGAYLIKYMTKNVSVELFQGRKLYLPSKGLVRPKEYKGLEAVNIIRELGLENKSEVFQSSYESEYLGKIVYREYNLNRC